MNRSKLPGMRGEVFNNEGRVAGMIPPSGRPDAITFSIGRVWPATNSSPPWTDMLVEQDIRVRINPEICQPPFFRLFDCVMLAATETDKILALDGDDGLFISLQGQTFLCWSENIGGLRVIMIDTEERVLKWNPQGANDGQHRFMGNVFGGSQHRRGKR